MVNTYGGSESSHASVNLNRLHVSLHSHLQSQGGLDKKASTSWSVLCMEVYHFSQSDPHVQAAIKANKFRGDIKDVVEGGAKIATASKYISQSAGPLGLSSARFMSYGVSGAAGIAGVLVNRFAPYLRKHNIQLDERGISLAVLCFGLAAAGAAPVVISVASTAAIVETFVLGVGLLGAGMNGYAFGKAIQQK
jgi:hypothetical protein